MKSYATSLLFLALATSSADAFSASTGKTIKNHEQALNAPMNRAKFLGVLGTTFALTPVLPAFAKEPIGEECIAECIYTCTKNGDVTRAECMPGCQEKCAAFTKEVDAGKSIGKVNPTK